MTGAKEIRAMKARKSSTIACGHHVLVGQKIISRGTGWRRRWICEPCALIEVGAAVRQTSTEERTQ
jgi:hypothetical protein